MKKIGVVQLIRSGRMDWFAPMLVDIINKFPNYSAYFVDGNPEQCHPDTDIILMMSFNKYDVELFEPYRKHAKIIAHLQCEQIDLIRRERGKIKILQDKKLIDLSIELGPDHYDETKKYFEVPTFLMPVGYDESMTLYQTVEKDIIDWDIFRLELIDSWSQRRTAFYNELKNLSLQTGKGFKLQYNKNLPLYDRGRIGYFIKNSKQCISVHSQFNSNAMASIRTICYLIANKGFVLHERCPKYPYLKDGEHIVYFDSPSDVIDKIVYYNEHQDEARMIADNAFNHIITNLRMDNELAKALVFISSLGG